MGEEPRVLHCNHRLRCKILQQRNLLVAEGSHLLPVDHNETDNRIVPAQRHQQRRASATQINQSAAMRFAVAIGFVVGQIEDLRIPFAGQQPSAAGAGAGRWHLAAQIFGIRRRQPVMSDGPEAVATKRPQAAEARLTQPHRLFQHRLEHRREAARR